MLDHSRVRVSIPVSRSDFIVFCSKNTLDASRVWDGDTMGGDSAANDATESKGTSGVNINIRCSNGSKFSVQISLESTIGSFKEVVAQKCDIPSDQQRLIYKGRILKDDQTLQSYGIPDVLTFESMILDLFSGMI